MTLSLEEMLLLSSLNRSSPQTRNNVLFRLVTILNSPKVDYYTLNATLDNFVHNGLVQKLPNQTFRITPEGLTELKQNFQLLQNMMLSIYASIQNS